jgi:hypothetical protein
MQFLNVRIGGAYSYHYALKGQGPTDLIFDDYSFRGCDAK